MQSPAKFPSLAALAKAGSQKAQDYLNYHRYAHIAALLLAASILFIKHPELLVYSIAVIAVAAELLAWWWHYQEKHYHHLSRELTRRALLQDAFGQSSDPTEISHLLQDMHSPQLIAQATQLDELFKQGGGYFTSQLPLGMQRCLDNLQESAFWSAYLYRIAALRTAWIILAGFSIAMILGFAIVPIVAQGHISVLPKLFSLLFIFWLADELNVAVAWWEASKNAATVSRRIEDLLKTADHAQAEILAIFSDYAVATAAAPPIPTGLYKQHRDHLNQSWEQHKAWRRQPHSTSSKEN